ncbi:type III-A CRISPR-associated RAMP protein Csm5 [Pectobacterium quasiaquaticum]|uniref:RAMP superfamily CRISPR-associated protein n=1 Tax=Pectobacterium quasiaquaticum TaxID=2774015 RepID=UPI001875F871|nr:RAMP superfamily CRISPR-associated protein [Pectobacterium quasiaquaticum]URG53576.1 type III-A CRISPR-associated RAMP protein Csm5 [Pectobacterium quasiaquaticum]
MTPDQTPRRHTACDSDNMQCFTLTCLSPVHVATGDSLNPGEYLIAENALYELGQGGLSPALTATQRSELLTILESNDPFLPLTVQRFLAREAGKLKYAAHRVRPLLPGISHYYQSRLGQVMQKDHKNKKQVINQLELMRHVGAALGAPYIPGSTLKGAIRTALVSALNQGQPLQAERLETDKLNNKVAQDTEHLLLKIPKRNVKDWIKHDPFHWLQVGDAVSPAEHPPMLDYWLVRRQPLKRTEKQNNKADNMELSPVECLKPRQSPLRCQITVKTPPAAIPIKNPRLKQWLGKVSQLAQQVNQITLPQCHHELAWLAENHIGTDDAYAPGQNWVAQMQQLLRQLDGPLQRGEALLLRVGKYGGAISKTVEGWRHIARLGKQGTRPTYHPDVTTCTLALPQADALTQALPFGWVLLHRPDQPEVAGFVASHQDWCQRQQQWLADHQQQQHAHYQQRQQLAQTREEEAQRLADKARQSQARQSIMSLAESLTSEQTFQRKKPNGPLRGQLATCVGCVAAEGSAEEKADLCTLFDAILSYWGIKPGKDKKLTALRNKLL